jgi:hypothetical protein
MISKTIFRLIDGLILCANKLCGLEPINFNGEEGDFLTYLLFSDEIGFVFRLSAILATILLVIFTVFMIIRSIAKEKADGTPVQIAVKAFKTILMFFLVPAVIVAFMMLGNAFVKALYQATSQGAVSPGAFLFSAFAEDGGMRGDYAELFKVGDLDYYDTSVVSEHMILSGRSLSDFPFIFSFLASGVVLFGVGSAMLIFVDRVISIVILYIAAPISLSTSILDDGARFKLWRDQFLSKFIMGYGMILAINIYALVCSLVMSPGFAFFEGEDTWTKFLDLIMKLLIIGGGALTMQKSMALVGNLVSQGAGSNELRDNAFSMGSLARMAKGVAGGALSKAAFATGLKIPGSVLGDALAMKSRDWGSKVLDAVGLGMGGKTSDKDGIKDPGGSSGASNNEKASYGSTDTAKNAIKNEGFKTSDWGKDNANNTKQNKKNDLVSNAINAGGKKSGLGENSNQSDGKGENK